MMSISNIHRLRQKSLQDLLSNFYDLKLILCFKFSLHNYFKIQQYPKVFFYVPNCVMPVHNTNTFVATHRYSPIGLAIVVPLVVSPFSLTPTSFSAATAKKYVSSTARLLMVVIVEKRSTDVIFLQSADFSVFW